VQILNLEPKDYSPDAQIILERIGKVHNGPLSREDLVKKISSFDVLIVRLGHMVDSEIFEHAENLKVIVTAATGLNHIDLGVAASKAITVLSLKGEKDFLKGIHATAEHAMALILSLSRKLPFAHNHVMRGDWDRDQFKGMELEGKTLGILGYGRLGKKTAAYAKAFGMSVIAYDIDMEIETDDIKFAKTARELAEKSDIVSIHITSTPENHHFINAGFINSMKVSAYLINTARGDVLDQTALLSALENQKIAGAALDVLEEEYEGGLSQSPLIAYAKKHRNLIITPHIGGATTESMHKTELFMANKLKNFLTGNI
jgi:D-3-phosphoglycerate dehydrogenase